MEKHIKKIRHDRPGSSAAVFSILDILDIAICSLHCLLAPNFEVGANYTRYSVLCNSFHCIVKK